MGLGVALGRRYSWLVHGLMPVLLIVSIPLAFSENLGLIRMSIPDSAVSLWTGEIFTGTRLKRLLTLILFIFLFCLVASVFIFAGAPVGYLFGKIRPLKA